MKNKFKRKSYIIKIILYILGVIGLYFLILYPVIKTDLKYIIVELTKNRFNNDANNYKNYTKSEYVYLTLNKITNFDSEVFLNEMETIKTNDIGNEVNEPLIYIYNSHQTEGYDYRKLEHTLKLTVLFASYILKDYLNDHGIESIVESSSMSNYLKKNNLKYKNSYEASRYYIKESIDSYPSIKYFIDLHRDSSTIKKTLYEKDNIRYARIMFVVGLNHNNSNKNLEFVTELNNRINKKMKGLSRGIYKREDAKFNQDISKNAILIELGGVDNTLEEINNTLDVFSNILVEYIEDNNGN